MCEMCAGYKSGCTFVMIVNNIKIVASSNREKGREVEKGREKEIDRGLIRKNIF